MDEWFNTTNEADIYVATALLIIGAAEAGVFFAKRQQAGRRDDADRLLSTSAAPLLGLLALMIGFTFAMSLSRFEARKSAVLEEANTIGTAALRGQMLGEPFKSAVAPLFKEYATLRITSRGMRMNYQAVRDAILRASNIQDELWRQATAAAAANPQVVPTGLFIQSLNDMIDANEKRLTAARNHVPTVVFLVLEGIAVVAIAFSGFGAQRAGGYHRVPMWIMSVVIGSVIILTIDLDRPQGGFITVSQQPLLDLVQSMK